MLSNVVGNFVFEFDFAEIVGRHVQYVFQTRNVLVDAYFAAHIAVLFFTL